MMKKKVWIVAAVAALSISSALPAMAAEWKRDDKGWWYVFDSGNYATNGWRTIDGKDYYFDADGYLAKGWRQLNYQWRYFRDDGTIATGWQLDNGKWYYFDANGNMRTGFLELGNKTYYMDEDGSMAVGQREIDGQYWYFESDGTARRGGGTFTQNNIKYRYKDNILERYNTVSNEWEAVPGAEDALQMVMDKLREDYVEKRLYSSEAAFEKDARAKLRVYSNYLTEGDLEDFIQDVEQEYNDAYRW